MSLVISSKISIMVNYMLFIVSCLDMHEKMDEDKEGTTDGDITFSLEEVLLSK